MNIVENINRIKNLMEITSNKKSLLIEGVDPKKVINLFYEFVGGTDVAARTKTLNKIRLLNTDEKKIFDDFVKNNSEYIKPGTKLTGVDDLAKIATTVELAKLAKVLASNTNQISSTLKNLGIDFSKYLAIKSVAESTNDQSYKALTDILKKDPTSEKLLNSIKTKKYDDVNWDDLQFTINKIRAAVNTTSPDPELNNAFLKIFNELFELSTEISLLNKLDDFNTSGVKTDLEPKQVAGIRINDDELENLNKIVSEKGLGKSWGWDTTIDQPISVTTQINGKNVEFSVTDKGPRTINWTNVKRDSSILEQFQQEYISSKQSVAQFLYLKFKNEPDKLDLYLPHYKVLGGVKIPGSNTIDGKTWVIVNSSVNQKNFNFVLAHEMTHVDQKSLESMMKSGTYKKANTFKTPEEALDFLYSKTQYIKNEGKVSPNLKWDEFKNQSYASDVLDEFSEQINGRDPLDNWDDYEKFMNWAYENDKIQSNLFDLSDKTVTYKTSNFGSDVKKRTFNVFLDEEINNPNSTQEQINKLTRIKNHTKDMDETQLLTYMRNNSADPEIKKLILKISDQLGYYLNKAEMEADFTGVLREIMTLGTNEEKAGFATWLVEWLKSSNKMEILNSKEQPVVPTKETFIQQVKSYFTKNTKKPVEPNNPYYEDLSAYFLQFFKDLENRYKKIYPNDAQKIYKGLYKQAYELISKGYPAILPFIAYGAKELMNDEPTQTTTNESKLKKIKLFEIYQQL
jgi:hypothetical protein